MKLADRIREKIQELKSETAMTYCGEFEHQIWEKERDAKISVLEEILYYEKEDSSLKVNEKVMKPTSVVFENTMIVKNDVADKMQSILNIEEGHYDGCDRDSTILSFISPFNTTYGNFELEVKVCNGNTPYVDTVLFHVSKNESTGEKSWEEVNTLEISDELLGEYQFELKAGGQEIILTLQLVKESDATIEQLQSKIEEVKELLDAVDVKAVLDRQDLVRKGILEEEIHHLYEVISEREK